MLPTSRRRDDADVIRARLRALLASDARTSGWVPDDPTVDADDVPPDQPSAIGLVAGIPPEPPSARSGSGDGGLPAGIGRHRTPGPAVRWDPGRRGVWALCVTGLLAALLLLAWTWLERPTVAPAPARSAGLSVSASPSRPAAGPSSGAARTASVGEVAATSSTVVVSVVGLVARPGLQTLPIGSRVADAVAAAGGLLAQADPASVNMAALVADGQQLAVGVPGAATGAQSAGGSAGAPAGPVNLNAATVAELDALPGIGPVLAQRIVDYRTQHGPFSAVDQLDDVPGIGPALYTRLAPQVRV